MQESASEFLDFDHLINKITYIEALLEKLTETKYGVCNEYQYLETMPS